LGDGSLRCADEYADIVVIGAGLAGLYAALLAAESGKKIIVLAKGSLEDSNTNHAQGGIAASICAEDSPDLHFQDTLSAGAGLCHAKAVRQLVVEGRREIWRLIDLGVPFDKEQSGLALTREGAHSRRRILHAQGDATGRVILETLKEKIAVVPNIILLANTFALELLGDSRGCTGVLCMDARGNPFCIRAADVVIASGGACQIYANTTNPPGATGDGIAMAWRLGARIADMEFVQFHPTALMLEGAPRFLISEAVRGEGAILLNSRGERFLFKYHAQGELAPRDVVSRAMLREMQETQARHLWLDARTVSDFERRFPTIYSQCKRFGLNLPGDLIPVAPAAHYFIGGVVVDQRGWTGIPGLYACGEASCTGVHGANRLASNSLLEALVFGRRVALALARSGRQKPRPAGARFQFQQGIANAQEYKARLRAITWRWAGLNRDKAGLEKGLAELEALEQDLARGVYLCRASMELANMLTVARLLLQAALLREESRGGHFRTDFPAPNHAHRGHWLLTRNSPPRFVKISEEEDDVLPQA